VLHSHKDLPFVVHVLQGTVIRTPAAG
jgi:hypothetical protein